MRALISVSQKPGIVRFTQRLCARFPEAEIVSTGGTAKDLREAGIKVTDVFEVTGFPEILRGRVKTLHPAVYAGFLADMMKPEDCQELAAHGFKSFDLVCCDFYKLAAEIAKPDATVASVTEETDIGGPTMARAAAKGGRIVISDPADRERVIQELEARGDVSAETRTLLRAKAEAVCAAYSLDSARFHSQGAFDGIMGWVVCELAYGENRDQSPAFLHATGDDDPLAWDKFEFVSGVPGYINMADGDKALAVLCLLAEAFRVNFDTMVPHIVIACKHGNPCGAAFDWDSPMNALQKALMGDPIAVMGAEVMTNFPIVEELAHGLFEVPSDLQPRVGRKHWGPDVVFAPRFDDAAIELLGRRETRRLVANGALQWPTMANQEWAFRPVRGGFLRQKAPNFVFHWAAAGDWNGQPLTTGAQLGTLLLAWAVAWRASSNTVILAKDNMLIGPGVGQMDRVACTQLAIDRANRAGHDTRGSLFASDAFYPYAERKREEDPLEGTELLARAGCVGGVVPADGKNLPEVKAFFKKQGMQVVFVRKEHRGFSQH